VNGATIRPAGPDDVPALAELAKRTWAEAFADSVSAGDAAAEMRRTRSASYFVSALRKHTILVAEERDRLLGYVQFGDVGISGLDAGPEDRELQRVYIETAAQGRGLGRSLTEAALRHPRLAGADRVYLQVWERNERAIRLYESLGFRAVGATTFTIGEEVAEDVVMVLDRRRAP
jgi:ribosomal protein S18 acetylase RimI-like enzyme